MEISRLEAKCKSVKLCRIKQLQSEVLLQEKAITASKKRCKNIRKMSLDPGVASTSSCSKTKKASSRDSRGSDSRTATGCSASGSSASVSASAKTSKSSSKSSSKKADGKLSFDVNEVRSDPKVKVKLLKALNKAGLNEFFDFPDTKHVESDESDTESVWSRRSSCASAPPCSKDITVLWPNQAISSKYTDFSQKTLKHNQLDIRMLNIGELEIISSAEISDEERLARTKLLKELNHFAGLYKWRAKLKLHSTVLYEIAKVGSVRQFDAPDSHAI